MNIVLRFPGKKTAHQAVPGRGPVFARCPFKTAVLFFALTALLPLGAQESSKPKDLVLVIDTSAGVFPYYDQSASYLSGPFLAENLNLNDTLHIISFGTKPRLEIARRMLGRGDIETAGSRIWLLYPLEPSSDVSAALGYTEQYVKNIPGGRSKKVFVVSGGDADAPVNAAVPRFRTAGAELAFIRVSSAMGSGRAAVPTERVPAGRGTTERSGGAAARTPALSSSGDGSGVSKPVSSGGGGQPSSGVHTSDGNASGGAAGSTGNAGGIPAEGTPPPDGGSVVTDNGSGTEGGEAGGSQGNTTENNGGGIQNPGGTVSGMETKSSAQTAGFDFASIPFPLLIALALLVLAIILIIIILKVRSLHASPKKVISGGTDTAAKTSDDAARNAELLNSFASRQAAASLQGPPRRYQNRDDSGQFLTNPPMLNLFVEEQNTAIGRRNVHALKKGNTYTVGGGISDDFLIFLVPLPSRLGQLSFDGTNCTFTPLRSSYFPDIGSSPVSECIGKTIRILSDKSYEIFFHFERYKDPLIVLNQLLHSIQVPEAPNRAG